MTDPLTSLYSLITSGWTLSGSDRDSIGNKITTPAKDIHCSTGWYDSSIITPQVTITPVSGVEVYRDSNSFAHVGESELYDIGVWVQVDRSTGKGEGYAKALLHALKEEVKRILRAGTITGVMDIQVGNWRFVPEPEKESPLLHWMLTVRLVWYKAVS